MLFSVLGKNVSIVLLMLNSQTHLMACRMNQYKPSSANSTIANRYVIGWNIF